MTEQQAYLYKMLCEIDDICLRHGISYSLAGGTLIGAIRHGGFLPWDDDADLYMTRHEWERFEAACKTELPKNRILQLPGNPAYGNTFPRYASLDTTAIHSHQVLNEQFSGEVIDVFVLDPMKSDSEVLEAYTHDVMLYSELVNYAGVFGRRFGLTAEEFEHWLEFQRNQGAAKTNELFENKLASYLDEDGDIYVMRWGGAPLVFERSWFDTVKRVPFEGRLFPIGVGIDEYLIYHYGDEWYQVPQISERSAHETASSLLIPAAEAREICLEKNRETVKRRLVKRKCKLLRSAPEEYRLQTERLKYEAELMARDTTSRFEELFGEFEQVFEASRIARYDDVFGRHIAWQFSARISGRDDWRGIYRFNHPVVARLPSEIQHTLLAYLFNSEQVGRAARLLDMCKTVRVLDDFEQCIATNVRVLRAARSALQSDDVVEAQRLVQQVLEAFPQNKTALKILVDALSKQGDDLHTRAMDAAERARALYPEDGDLAYAQARLLEAQGDVSANDICNLFSFAITHTRNGLTFRGVQESDFCTEELHELARSALAGNEITSSPRRSAFETETAAIYQGLQQAILHVCNQAQVQAFLNPLQAFHVQEGVEHVYTSGNAYVLYMHAEQMKKLVTYLEADSVCLPEHVEYEYLGNNPSYPDLTVRFYDVRTTNLSTKRSWRYVHSGMFVSVQVFKPPRTGPSEKARRKVQRLQDTVNAATGSLSVVRLSGSSTRTRRMFERSMDSCARKRKRQRVEIGHHTLTYPSRLFDNCLTIACGGEEAFIPADAKRYAAPIVALLYQGKLNFAYPRWSSSPRVSVSHDSRERNEQLKAQQRALRHKQVFERLTRKQFVHIFAAQKAAIAEEDERRRLALGGEGD